ncbi:hypothetical protein ScPMuIL_016104 [Solemya velum]
MASAMEDVSLDTNYDYEITEGQLTGSKQTRHILHHHPSKGKQFTSLVISPLKSLMQDQVQALRKHNISAYAIHEGMEKTDISAIKDGTATVLMASPESVITRHWKELIRDTYGDKLCVVAYDEAHCISEWGLEFREDYQKVGILQSLLEAPVLALTATATKEIHKDITRVLGLHEDTKVLATLPDRPNIFVLVAKRTDNFETELQWVSAAVADFSVSCKKILIYVNSITMCETIYIWLHSILGKKVYSGDVSIDTRIVEMFHAHTDLKSKERIMSNFCQRNSSIRVLIATIACGMGIDIPDDIPD